LIYPALAKVINPKLIIRSTFFAESVKNVLDDLKITNPVLIGHSLGTAICRQLIFKYPNLNAILCDIDGVYCNFPSGSPDDNKNFMKTLYSNMQYYEFDNVWHFIMMENPQKFNSILWHFLESVNSYK
jgi:pimeloyl-ACP methyl ester carboxylesterase